MAAHLAVAAVALATAVSASRSNSQSCRPITDQQKAGLEAFIKSWYKLPDNQAVTLADSSSVDSSCYRKLVFRASVPAPLLTLYLTPDGQHLVSGMMDLSVDPAVAQRKIRQEQADKLIAGAWLIRGNDESIIKMVVFSDFQCPYCKRFAEIVQQLTPDERSKLQIVYRQLPLNIHSWARDAAALSTCVALQDKSAFWKLHDFLFAHQEELSKDTLQSKALDFLSDGTSLDTKLVSNCLNQKLFEDRLHQDEQLAMDLGITSTPSVFLNGRRISARSVDDLRNALRTAEQDDLPSEQLIPKAVKDRPVACLREADTHCTASKSAP